MSLMVSLPPELRDEIYKLVLGERLVSLNYYLRVQHDSRSTASERNQYAWEHVADELGSPGYVRWLTHGTMNDEVQSIPIRQGQHLLASECTKRRIFCTPFKTISLRLLRSCWQIYYEATRILWTTNIFSFHDLRTFSRFMRARKPYQLQLMSNLSLQMDYYNRMTSRAWTSALQTVSTRSPLGLRHLYLFIQQLATDGPEIRLVSLPGRFSAQIKFELASSIRSLSSDSLATVQVSIQEVTLENRAKLQIIDGSNPAVRKLFADSIRKELLGS